MPFATSSQPISSAIMSCTIDIKPSPAHVAPSDSSPTSVSDTKSTRKSPSVSKKRSSNSSVSPDHVKSELGASPKNRARPAQVNSEGAGFGGGRKTGFWTKKEIRALWNSVIAVPVRFLLGGCQIGRADKEGAISWQNVASNVQGRDKLVCISSTILSVTA